MDDEIKYILEYILYRIKDKFPLKELRESDEPKSSTATRVLMSDEYYEKFKDYYNFTSSLSSFIYKQIYQKGEIRRDQRNQLFQETEKQNVTFTIPDEDKLRAEFQDKRPLNTENSSVWSESYWQYEKKHGILRKEGYKLLSQNGLFLKKESIPDKTANNNKGFINAELIHASFDVSEESENDNLFHWIYGKYQFIEDYSIRFYWNFHLNLTFLWPFLKYLQNRFDENKIPFKFKFLAKPDEYKSHTDVGVLYLPRKHSLVSFEIVYDIHNRFKSYNDFLYENTPLFTKKLGKGLSFGENPDDRRYASFGSYRAIHIAMSIVKYTSKNNQLPTANKLYNSLDAKNKRWLKKFHVNQFSEYDYQHEIDFFRNRDKKDITSKLPVVKIGTYASLKDQCLSIAIKIAHILIKEAIWFKDTKGDNEDDYYPLSPNWVSFVSRAVIENNENATSIGIQYKALDNNDFLEGRLGVLFFLVAAFQKETNEFFKSAYTNSVTGGLDYYEGVVYFINELKKYEKDKQGDFVPFAKIAYSNFVKLFTNDRIDNDEHTELIGRINKCFLGNRFDNDKIRAEIEKINKGEKVFNFQRKPDAWRDTAFTKLIDTVLKVDDFKLTKNDLKLVEKMISEYFDKDRPFGNALGSDEFCVTLKNGYAALGYFFLRLYDKKFCNYLGSPLEVSH